MAKDYTSKRDYTGAITHSWFYLPYIHPGLTKWVILLTGEPPRYHPALLFPFNSDTGDHVYDQPRMDEPAVTPTPAVPGTGLS